VTFGTSRGNSKKALAAFKKAINALCGELGEGDGFNDSPILHKKDDKIDIVSWRDFNDKRPGKLVLFGQCATGNNWIDKVDEVQPDRFWKQWILRPNVSHLMRVFYIPHRVDKAYWDYYSRAVGLLFDRCRLAYWAFQGIDSIETDARYDTWCSEALRSETA
jgi:hypothetical protein